MKYFTRLTFLVGILLIGPSAINNNNNGKLFEISKNIEIFVKTFKELNSNYVDDIDPSVLMKVGIDAMVKSLDPYTNYISEAQIESYRLSDDDTYKGIGARMEVVKDKITIVEPYDGSPATKAGLIAGDQITHVNGLPTDGKNIDDLDRIVRGVPGTELNLSIFRPATATAFNVAILRSDVSRENVPYYGMVKDGVGYVILTTFTNNSSKNIASAIKKMKEEEPDLKGIILDLRSNGGGLLREAIMVSNLFVNKGEEIVSTKGKIIERDQSYKAQQVPLDLQTPLAILINKNSASASEIVSGVMQDLDRGVLIGQRSYGKGLVQNTVDIAYNNRVKLTTSKYYIPSGRCIQSVEYENGKPVDISDELRSKFKTNNGRTVLDGGGVAPDIKMEEPSLSPLIKTLKDKYYIFNFVNEYVTTIDSVKNVDNYAFYDYDKFLTYLDKDEFTFETESEKNIKKLRDNLGKDFKDKVSTIKLTEVENEIMKAKGMALQLEKEDVIREIEKEVISRFFLQSGRVKFSLLKDPEVLKAVEILTDPSAYNKVLGN